MCQKQCRDENGFKCHTTSESHQRQLLLFADNSRKYLDSFSYEFEKCFLQLLKRQFGTKRVSANLVYQEYIRDRSHTHMNATKWTTLTGFVRFLGKTGKAVVDDTEKGWFITYIDRDPETIARQEADAKKQKLDQDDQERTSNFIEKQVERARQSLKEEPESVFTELKRDAECSEKIQLQISLKPKSEEFQFVVPSTSSLLARKETKSGHDQDDDKRSIKSEGKREKEGGVSSKRKLSALDEIMRMQEASKEKVGRKDYWLAENIVVKVVTKSLGDKYYKKKGYIKQVVDNFTAVVCMLDSGHTLKLDQAHLETVIPAQGIPLLLFFLKKCAHQ